MYYNDSFCSTLRKDGINSVVISNYKSEYSEARLANIYSGSIIFKAIKLIYNAFVLLYLLSRRNNRVVYLSYGTSIDIIFMRIGLVSKTFYIDIHEYIQTEVHNNEQKRKFDKIFMSVPLCIYHSSRTSSFLNEINRNLPSLYVPHFKYKFDKSFMEDNIPTDITQCIKEESLNFLFFGHFRKSKGINVLIDAITSLQKKVAGRYHFIFAGADPHHEFEEVLNAISITHGVSVVARYIETEELNYLFSKVDAVVLPYYEVSQSGVLETAVFFGKQLVLSDISYFKVFVEKFPSFGYLFNSGSSEDLVKLLSIIQKDGLKSQRVSDISKFYQKDEFDVFIKEFSHYL